MKPKNPSLRVLDERRKFEGLVSIGIRFKAERMANFTEYLREMDVPTARANGTDQFFMGEFATLHEYDLAVIGQEYMRSIEGRR